MGGFVQKIFYDENGNNINVSVLELLKKGLGTTVYKTNDNECLKIFTHPGDDLEMFKRFSELDLDNFYKITKLLYDKKDRFMAYTAKFYDKEDIDILTMPIDYTIENMEKLYEVSDILSNNKIRIEDLHHENVILTSNDIIIIDADKYVYDEEQNCYDYNRRYINSLFTLLYMTAPSINFLTSNQDYLETVRPIRALFFSENTPEVVSKKLCKYKRPFDYLKK